MERVQHPWNIGIEGATEIQRRLSALVVDEDRFGEVHLLAGVDISGVRSGGEATAAAVLLSFPDLQLREESRVRAPLGFPYVPGFLSFREAPLMLEALKGLSERPDLVLVDGQGRAHPRGLGIASHLGLLLDLPTIGCAKSRLVGRYDEPAEEAGSASPLQYRGETVGMVLRTRSGSKPIFVSVGHRISLWTATDLVRRCTRSGERIPEPTRLAHIEAGRV